MEKKNMSKVLVTGGAGFIGSNLTEALLQRGHLVRVLDDFSTGKRENLIFDKEYPSLEIIEGDIRDLSTCQKAVRGNGICISSRCPAIGSTFCRGPGDVQRGQCRRDFEYSSCRQGERGEKSHVCRLFIHLWRYSYLTEA